MGNYLTQAIPTTRGGPSLTHLDLPGHHQAMNKVGLRGQGSLPMCDASMFAPSETAAEQEKGLR